MQKKIIQSDKNTILVSSSAGCGKTTTLIGRVVYLIENKKCDISEILCLTFTNNAAYEMRKRLEDGIRKSNLPKSIKIDNLQKLEYSDVCTIDAFCNKIVRRFFYKFGISSSFEIMDEGDRKNVELKVLDSVLEEYYSSNDPEFLEFYDVFLSNRSDKELRECILKFAEINAYTLGEFIEKYKSEYESEDNSFTRYVASEFQRKKELHLASFRDLRGLEFTKTDAQTLQDIIDLLEQINATDYTSLSKIDFSLPMIRPLKKAEKETFIWADNHERLKEEKNELASFFKEFNQKFFSIDSTKNLSQSLQIIQMLAKIWEKYVDRLREYKLKKSRFDFSDIEKFAIQIMSSEEGKKAICSSYKYIFVDEAQDLNDMQSKLIACFDDAKVFEVGDIKQCIYRFRGSDPKIFREFCEFVGFDTLSENFRTNKYLLKFIDSVFSRIMFSDFAMVDYGKTECFVGNKAGFVNDGKMPVVVGEVASERGKIVASDYFGGDNHYKFDDSENIGNLLAREITNLLGKKIIDEKGERNIKYSDIAVLVRGKKDYSAAIKRVLERANIPITSNFELPALEIPAIASLIAYLKLIDNYFQDIPLVSALSLRFSNYELATIKVYANQNMEKKSFSEMFLEYATSNTGELAKKAQNFLQGLKELKLFSQQKPVDELIYKIISNEKLSLLFAKQNSENLVGSFIEKIKGKRYSENLTDFLKYFDAYGDRFKIADNAIDSDSVLVSTIHKAKGLEYPIVFLVGLENQFNFSDDKKKFPIARELGIGLEYFDFETKTRERSFYSNAIKMFSKQQTVLDEINVLYVAMTRAKYRLYLLFTSDGDEKPLTRFNIGKAKSYKDMLITAIRDPNCSNLFSTLEADIQDEVAATTVDKVYNYDEKNFINVKKYIDFQYKYPTNTLAKVTTSEVLSREENLPFVHIKTDETSNIEIGNAYHYFLEHSNICTSISEFDAELERLTSQNLLTSEQAKLISATKILNFYATVFEPNIIKVFKEQQFIANLAEQFLGLGTSEEKVLVQGKIDCVLVYKDKIKLIDYKFSTLSKASLIARYKKQLDIYGEVLSQIYTLPIQKVLYSFVLEQEVEVGSHQRIKN